VTLFFLNTLARGFIGQKKLQLAVCYLSRKVAVNNNTYNCWFWS